MRILADENIPLVREAFAELGHVETMPGRVITPEAVKDVSMLLVRSITRVNRALLAGSAVRFVATATIGEDHIHKGYLEEQGIVFASAPGSNADSVGQYMVSSLFALAERYGFKLEGTSLGIVGVGNVGSRVVKLAAALGMRCVLNDPPLARQTGDKEFRPLGEILACDIVTLHVPLTKHGPDATEHLVDADFLRRVKRGAILINTSRGPVADGKAIQRALDDGHLKACVLDVWEDEPNVDAGLLERVAIGTPHIAGYSFDGKVNGTRMIYEAACRFLGRNPTWDPAPLLPKAECPEVTVAGDTTDPEEAMRRAVFAVYDVRQDDAAMRHLLDVPESKREAEFDRLRKEYPRRMEFPNTRARVVPPSTQLESVLAGLGFAR